MALCVTWSDTVSGLPCMKNQWSHIMVVLDAVFAYVKDGLDAIEPMINTGTWEIDTDMETGWAHKTLDGGLSCQYEHQFVITKDGPVILTSQGEEGTY